MFAVVIHPSSRFIAALAILPSFLSTPTSFSPLFLLFVCFANSALGAKRVRASTRNNNNQTPKGAAKVERRTMVALSNHCYSKKNSRRNMAKTTIVVGSLMLSLGPLLVVCAVLTHRHPQLIVMALASSAAYFIAPIFVTSLWHCALGEERFESAQVFFSLWSACATEVCRFLMCRTVVRAEQVFRGHGQSLYYTREYRLRQVPLGLAVGLGFAVLHAALSVGVVANAEVALTWDDISSEYFSITAGSEAMSWVDVNRCPRLPKLVAVAIQSLLFSVAHLTWSVIMVQCVSALAVTAPRNECDEDRQPLRQVDVATPPASGASQHREDSGGDASSGRNADAEEMKEVTASPGTSPLNANTTSVRGAIKRPTAKDVDVVWPALSALSRRSAMTFITVVVLLHVVFHAMSFASSGALKSVDCPGGAYVCFSSTRGCEVVLPLQAVVVVVSAVAAGFVIKAEESQ